MRRKGVVELTGISDGILTGRLAAQGPLAQYWID